MQFGYDAKFMNKMLDKAIQTFPNDIYAWIMKAELKSAEFERTYWTVGYPSIKDLPNYPKQNKLFNELLRSLDKVDDLGYSKMPKEAYDKWLQTLEQKKNKQNSKQLKLNLLIKALD
jgi:hypothetical protein